MNTFKLFLVATLAAVVTLASASFASAGGNRFGTLNIIAAAQSGSYEPKQVHYRNRYRRYRHYRRHRRYHRHRYRRYGYNRSYRYRRYYRRRHYRHHYYGPSIYFRAPGFGFHFGY